MTPRMTKEREEYLRDWHTATFGVDEIFNELDATREDAVRAWGLNLAHKTRALEGEAREEVLRANMGDEKKLIERIKALRECLKFYADENEWIDYKAVCEDGTEVDSHFDGDMGAKAIAALIADEKEDVK